MDTLNRWFEQKQDKAEFKVIYISEAHPTAGRQVAQNRRDGVLIQQHKALADRIRAARKLQDDLKLTLPIWADSMENSAATGYSAWPDRIFVLDKRNLVRYRGGPGPGGFHPSEAMKALDELLAK